MKHIKLAVVSVLVFAANGAYAAYPADAEASYDIAASSTYADMQARKGEQSEAWGVSKRQAPTPHNAFPFGGGPVDD